MAQWTVRMFLRKGEWDVRFNRTSDGPQSVKNYVGKDSWAGTGSFWRSLIDSPVKQTNWTRHSLKVFLQSHIEISTILNLQIGHSNSFTQQLKVYFWDTSKCYEGVRYHKNDRATYLRTSCRIFISCCCNSVMTSTPSVRHSGRAPTHTKTFNLQLSVWLCKCVFGFALHVNPAYRSFL